MRKDRWTDKQIERYTFYAKLERMEREKKIKVVDNNCQTERNEEIFKIKCGQDIEEIK